MDGRGVCTVFINTQFKKQENMIFNKNVSSLSSRDPSIALLGVRGSSMIEGAKNDVSSFHKSTVIRHSQKK